MVVREMAANFHRKRNFNLIKKELVKHYVVYYVTKFGKLTKVDSTSLRSLILTSLL